MTPTADAHLSAPDGQDDLENAQQYAQEHAYSHGKSARVLAKNKNIDIPSTSGTQSKDDIDSISRDGASRPTKACCFICGSAACTAIIVCLVCFIIPLITILITVHRAQKTAEVAMNINDDFLTFLPDNGDDANNALLDAGHNNSSNRFLRVLLLRKFEEWSGR